MDYELGHAIQIPEEFAREIKVLHDYALSTKAKRRTATHDLWVRVFALVPESKNGTWEIRHGLTTVYVVKLDHGQRSI